VTKMIIDDFHQMRARRLGIDTHSENVVFLRKDSTVCRSEGFSSHNRILLSSGTRHAIATLYQVEDGFLSCAEAGLSDATWRLLGLNEGDTLQVRHAPPVESLGLVRGRIFGHPLEDTASHQIVADIVAGRYSAIEISSFITACAANPLSIGEIAGLTRAMVDNGQRLSWDSAVIADKHSVGGLPGNRITPIVVAICASLGLVIPKTSSRAITSPSGTADMMETLAPVILDEKGIRAVVKREGGCIAWGGAVTLSPADDILIRIERALDLDSEGQMIASILSKKIAAGATHLVIDMPIGPTAKVRTMAAAQALEDGLATVAKAFGIRLRVVRGDGSQPIGRGIGPALEARDVLAVLKGEESAPKDLRARALVLAGALLELTGKSEDDHGIALATQALDSGRAWAKFQRICEAQGGMRSPPVSSQRKTLTAIRGGMLMTVDNRRIARLAKLAGAPEDKAAGVELHVRIGDIVAPGTPLCTVHAESEGELEYALAYSDTNPDTFRIAEP
jgi:thymidine phosphorylase